MIVTSTGVVSRKYRNEGKDGAPSSGKACNLLVRFSRSTDMAPKNTAYQVYRDSIQSVHRRGCDWDPARHRLVGAMGWLAHRRISRCRFCVDQRAPYKDYPEVRGSRLRGMMQLRSTSVRLRIMDAYVTSDRITAL